MINTYIQLSFVGTQIQRCKQIAVNEIDINFAVCP